jgi:hypothetical protein
MSENDYTDSTPPLVENAEEIEEETISVEEAMPIEEHWICIACSHYEVFHPLRCSACQCFKTFSISGDMPVLKAPVSRDHHSDDRERSSEDQKLLDLAFQRIHELFRKAQKEGRSLTESDRVVLYENLLISLLKVEREEVRKASFLEVFQEDREEKRHSHMLHLSIIWFLGICTGFALYFALESVRSL